MIVILLLIFWMQRPMTFSASWRRALITTAIVLVALLPTGMLGFGGPTGATLMSSAAAQAPDSPLTYDRALGGDTASSGSERRQSSTYDRTSGLRDSSQRRMAPSSSAKRLREGTLVPSTVGTFEMIGRRWIFISRAGGVADPTNVHGPARTESIRSETRVTDDAFFSDGLLNRTTSLTYTEATADRRASSVHELPDLLVVENLMLQRIVEAIREDTEDNRWEITGVVTEFFDENRLTILTAKRSAEGR